MKSMNLSLPVRALALAAAIGLAGPAFARDHEDRARDHANHPGPQQKSEQRAQKPQRETRREPDARMSDVRRNESFAPSRPDPRALEVREREQAQARSAQQRQEAMQRIEAQREKSDRDAQRRDERSNEARERALQQQRDRDRTADLAARREADRDRERARVDQARHEDIDRTRDIQEGQAQSRQAQSRQADLRRNDRQRDAQRREDALREARRDEARREETRREETRRETALRERTDRERARHEARVSEQERQRRIELQQQRLAQYRRDTAAREAAERQRIVALQNSRRMQQFRYQQDYWRRQRELRDRWNDRGYSYYNDPFYYTPASYRYLRGGRWYDVNRYAADLLQEALRRGYDQGYRAGEADRLDGWRYDYRGNYAYLDANLGYYGYYVDQSEYNYYFRQAFRRGYQDGYARAYRYGRYDDGSYVILASVLQSILNLRPY